MLRILTLIALLICPRLGLCDDTRLEYEDQGRPTEHTLRWNESILAGVAGVRHAIVASRGLFETGARLDLNVWSSRHNDFRQDAFSRAREDQVRLTLNQDLEPGQRYFAEFSSYAIKQDIRMFGQQIHDNPMHAVRTISVGYAYHILPQTELRLSQGLAYCSKGPRMDNLLPVGAVRLTHTQGQTATYLEVGQSADGDNGVAGLYGTQYRRRVQVGMDVGLSPTLLLSWSCQLSKDFATLSHQVSAIAQAELSYRMNDTLVASASVGHRGHYDAQSGVRVSDGMTGSFSLTAMMF